MLSDQYTLSGDQCITVSYRDTTCPFYTVMAVWTWTTPQQRRYCMFNAPYTWLSPGYGFLSVWLSVGHIVPIEIDGEGLEQTPEVITQL